MPEDVRQGETRRSRTRTGRAPVAPQRATVTAGSGAGWHTLPAVAFDTETTGVDATSDRIVTAALVGRTLHDGATLTTRSWLIDPGVEIPAGATAVHGISTEHAREHGAAPAPALEEIASALAASARAGHAVVAFNAPYDLTILHHELRRHRLPTLDERLEGAALTVIDPLVLDRALDRFRRGKRTLTHLCEVYEVVVTEDLHSAHADAGVTLQVLAGICRRYPDVVTMDGAALMEFQRTEHERWAVGFNQWRERQGFPGEGASTTWL